MKLAYIANVFDPETREKNEIVSDSPTAFNKVFNVSQCIKTVNSDISVVSLGIFNSLKKKVKLQCKMIHDIPVSYIILPRNKILRHIVIQFKLPAYIIKNKFDGIIIYNYYIDYFLLVLLSFIFKKNILVDIEDGINDDASGFLNIIRRKILDFYLKCSKNRAIVVSSLLKKHKYIKKSCIVYSAGTLVPYRNNNTHKKLSVLFSGTIIKETGGLLLIDLIKEIAIQKNIPDKIEINISGYGKLLDTVKEAVKDFSFVNCYGYLSDKDYKAILANTDIGLVLKSNDNAMGRTTFPSKIVEFALNRIAIMAIPSSDIPVLFNENEVIFVNGIKDMIENLIYFIEHREELEARKKLIAEKAAVLFDEKTIGKNIVELFQAE